MGQLDVFPIAYVGILLTSYTQHIQTQVPTSSKTYPPMLRWLRVVRRHGLFFAWKMPWVFLPPVKLCIWHASIIACPPKHLPVKILPSEMGSLPLTLLSLRLIFPFSCISTSHPCDLILLGAVFYHALSFSTSTSFLTLFSPHFSKSHLYLKTHSKCYIFFHKHFLILCIECAISFC